MARVDERWGKAFLLQAQSDLETYERLAATSLPPCHRLHYLQMWLEKLCKAHLWTAATTGGDLPEYRTSHNVIAKVLPMLIREHWRAIGFLKDPNYPSLRALCREIDLLHPQIDDAGARPDNVEYPWATFRNGSTLVVWPAGQTFKIAERITQPTGRLLMKAAVVLTRGPILWCGEPSP